MAPKKTTLKTVATSALIPYARNSRTHSEAQVSKIAASIREFGFLNPIIVDGDNGIIAGHGRVMAAQKLGLAEVPVIEAAHLTEAQKRAYVIADNRLALDAGWDNEMLKIELADLKLEGFDLELTGFNLDEIADFLLDPAVGLTDEDAVPEVPAVPVTVEGDVWLLGRHRVMCGDSTSIDAVERLMEGDIATLLHADPPYGMGKAADGVANDNKYNDKLDAFQMEWWATCRTFLSSAASVYIWGNAPELWRLWYQAGIAGSEKLELRNEIVWDKKASPGMRSKGLTQYQTASERCLFFQLGEQFRGNLNADEFPEDWDPIRAYLEQEAVSAGVTANDIKRICGCGMFSHWFTPSQFTLIPQQHYVLLASHYPGKFTRPWKELKREWDAVKTGPTAKMQMSRSYFDNTHDSMRDVWEFGRVTGDERHGHATPKPVAMMERVMRSSLPVGGLCVEPFGGGGSTLIGAEKTGRICYTMELQPRYCDVIVKRWQDYTGQTATLEATGQTFAEMEVTRDKTTDRQ